MILERAQALRLIAERKLSLLSIDEREAEILDYWTIEVSDPDFQKLPVELQEAIISEAEPTDFVNPIYDHLILLSLMDPYRGVKNEFIASEMKGLFGEEVLVEGKVEKLFACPCCGYLTLTPPYDFAICRVCRWEYTGVDQDIYSGPNHMTLQEGKANFKLHGACDLASVKYKEEMPSNKYYHANDYS